MPSTGRADAHRPAAMEPADYEYVGAFVNRPPTDLEGNEADVENALWPVPGFEPLTYEEALSEGRSPDRAYPGETGRCDHCGQRVNYAAVYRHKPADQFVVMGHRCADSVMGYEDRRALRAAGQRDLVAAARKDAGEEAARREKLAEARKLHPGAYAILDGYSGPNRFLRDVAGRLAETGALTAPQADSVVEAHARDLERARRREAGEEKPVPGGVAGEKGVVVEGVVVKAVEQPEEYGSARYGRAYKVAITVRDDRGFVVWGRAPASLHDLVVPEGPRRRDVGKGDRVRFVANVEAKKNDPYFGFFRLPRKAEVLVLAEPPEDGPAKPDGDEGRGRRVFMGDVVEEVREEVREAGGVPDATSARDAVAVLDGIVEKGAGEDGEPAGSVLRWWRDTEGGDLRRFREKWDEKRRNNALGAYRQIKELVDAGRGGEELAGQVGPIAEAYVRLGGDPEDVGR